MNLIAYSDSEESDAETTPVVKPAAKPAPKPAFQKVVDRTNSGRIKINLPGASKPTTEKDELEAEARPAKRARLGAGGAFSGFNAMLPAPKKPNVNVAIGGTTPGKKTLGKGLGAGVSLKTGAEPAFRREPKVEEEEEYDENGNAVKKQPLRKEDFRALLNLPPPTKEPKAELLTATAASSLSTPIHEAALPSPAAQTVAKPKPRFLPLSVARGKKKKPIIPRPAVTMEDSIALAPESDLPKSAPQAPKPAARPKISLFGVAPETASPAGGMANEPYQPMLYCADDMNQAPAPAPAYNPQSYAAPQHTLTTSGASNDLTSIASELNLTESEKRQLFGRKGQGPDLSSAKIVEFNTDQEYLHNEHLRQQGEMVQHNALKSITGTGKNSLKGLVSMAVTQKDALEEHFAAGRRNKKEAGNKYGW